MGKYRLNIQVGDGVLMMRLRRVDPQQQGAEFEGVFITLVCYGSIRRTHAGIKLLSLQ